MFRNSEVILVLFPFLSTDSDCPPLVGCFESLIQKFEIFYLFDQFYLVGCLKFTFYFLYHFFKNIFFQYLLQAFRKIPGQWEGRNLLVPVTCS